jgi:hypothetical protein
MDTKSRSEVARHRGTRANCSARRPHMVGVNYLDRPYCWSRPPEPTVADGQKRAMLLQQKTQRLVQFEITPSTVRMSGAWMKFAGLTADKLSISQCSNRPRARNRSRA